jgi:hypothetical protein
MQGCGEFEATGNYHLATKAGDARLRLASVNQNALRPFLATALGDRQLVSVALDTTADARLGANGDASVKADARVANLVVVDPKGTLPATPLEARVQADAGVSEQVAQVRQLQLTLTPTERARNQLSLTGTVDFSKTNAITGRLTLAAEALDLTRYYDLFADKSKATVAHTPPPAAAPGSSPDREPDAVQLPFKNFAFEANIGRLFLREVDITNLQATAKLDGGRVVVQPCQLTLNGAPVSANVDADLGVPGFKYDLALNADKVPLTPLVNSFVPERKGQLGGTTTVGAQLRGAGVTGANLQKNLTGQFSMLSTNLNLAVANVRNPLLKLIINVVTSVPELVRDPAGTALNLVGSLVGARTARGGFAEELNRAPLDVILARGQAGGGRLTLETAEVRSVTVDARATGGIGLEPVLTNSTIQFPVTVALGRALADKIGLLTPDIPTNQPYVALPDFLKMKGTLGEPKADINKLALVGLAAKSGAGIVKQVGGASTEKAGSILGAVGNILGGGTPPPATSTNAPGATNPAPGDPAANLLRGLGGLLGGPKPTAPSTNAPVRPRRP